MKRKSQEKIDIDEFNNKRVKKEFNIHVVPKNFHIGKEIYLEK